jgi:ADP-heptose:LPS heptosyltransferase
MALFKKTGLFSIFVRHWRAVSYVISVIIPAMVRTRRKPVIFSRWGGMGDIICSIPAVLELKKRHPGAKCFYNCDPDFALIPKITEAVDACTHCREIGIVGHWYRFMLGGFYHFSRGDDSPQSTSKIPMFQEFCEQFGVPLARSHPRLPISSEALKKVRMLLAARGAQEENLILFHCGPSWPVREWTAGSWAELADGLRRHGFTNLVQIGLGGYMQSQQTQPVHHLGSSVDLGKATVQPIPQTISLIGALSLEESIAAISLAKLLVGIDSGPLHIAACLGTPAVGVFGPTLPKMLFAEKFREDFVVSSVDCAGCSHRIPRMHWITGCPYGIKCMQTLEASDVLQACLRRLSGNTNQFRNATEVG